MPNAQRPTPNILFVGGGSVGHIAPSIAVWEELKKMLPDSSAHFVCSPRRDDAPFLEKYGLSYTVTDAPRLSLMFPLKFFGALKHARKILDTQKPDVIFSKGGYVSLPLCFAAKKKGIPIVMHESDAVSGRANSIVSRWATAICTSFPDNRQPTTDNRQHTGNPVRKAITQGSREEGLRIAGLSGQKPILLITGGSQGAEAINKAVESILKDLLLRCNIIHITGRGKGNNHEAEGYFQMEFATKELPDLYACTDIAISRGGANALTDFSVCGIPTIVIPLRGKGHDHQYKNAILAEETGGCIHLEQSDLNAKLLSTVHELVSDEDKLKEMSANIGKLSSSDAAVQIAKIIAQTLDSLVAHQ